MSNKTKKQLLLNLPYFIAGLVCTNLGEAWRIAEGADMSEKLLGFLSALGAAFSNPMPSLHPMDLLIGVCCGAGLRLAVYLKGKNAKKYRHGMEYGSARWGTQKDIEPFEDPVFANNVILTRTERLMMGNRPKNPANARNKNVLVVGGSGSGKTRFWLKPNLLQCHSSYVVTDPKGDIVIDCGQALLKNGYSIRIFNTINFRKSMHYNPFAYIHDPHPPGHNPHAHVLLTMRAMDEHGKWLPKSRKVYDLDENGERIKLPSGRWKSHKEDTVDWNDQKYCEIWRHEWEVIQNRYLEANDRPERVDLRSYARQGLDVVPTVHEGAAVRQMEKRGIQTNIGNLNREIRAANSMMKSIRQLIQNLKGWITELGEKRKELLAQKAAEEATLLPNLLMKYMEIRKEERKDWTRAGQNRGTSQDLKAVSEALSYLRQKGLSTVEDLEAFLESSGKSAADYRNQMKPKEARSKVIDGILASRTDCKECKPVYEKYQKIFFKKTKEKFKQEHPEVARYAKAAAYLAKHPDDKDSTQKELQQEQEKLLSEIAELKVPLTEVQEDLKKLRDIRYWVQKATPGTEESKEPPKKQPIKEVLQDKADEKKAQRTAPVQTKHKQQDMEL